MKLLAKTSLVYLFATTIVFAAGGLLFYSNLRAIIDEETSEKLLVQKGLLEKYVEAHDTLPAPAYDANELDFIRETATPVKKTFSDTFCFSKEEEELLPFRLLLFPVEVNGKKYAVQVSRPMFESDDLVETILYSFILVAAALLVVTLVVNALLSRRLLRPFFKTIKNLDAYRLEGGAVLQPSPTSTREFRQLNTALESMTQKISADYHNLKEFTENASHEIQTPLAIILSTTELLLQKEQLDEKQAELIRRTHQSARRLSRLNQALLLLTKIGNRQFAEKENGDLEKLVEGKLDQYADLFAHKSLQLEKTYRAKPVVQLHPALADILLSNLLTNAIRHSPEGGRIRIELEADRLTVKNSGAPLQAPGEKLFERFYKENPSSESTGLGLALARQIATTHDMTLTYRYEDGLHCFELRF